jgi:diadenosine tetraphosphatase ApaH/serine/threonine PP2A family protein phosphatase
MRVLIISDIHANFTALSSVLEAASKVDAIWCLGDLVGYGPDPNECIELFCSLPNTVCLLGNHDAAAFGMIDLESFNREARISAEWMRAKLSPKNIQFLKGLPAKVEIENVTLTHGSPRNPVWEYMLDNFTASLNFDYFNTPLCFVGHTHLPMAYFASQNGNNSVENKMVTQSMQLDPNRKTILNPGSVGQPRDHDPRAAYAIFNTENLIWEPQRVDYDIHSVQRRIYAAGLPNRHALRLANGW